MGQLSKKDIKQIRRRYSKVLPRKISEHVNSNIESGEYSLKFVKFIKEKTLPGYTQLPIMAQILGNYNTVKFRPFKSIIEPVTDLLAPIKGMLKIALGLTSGVIMLAVIAMSPLLWSMCRLMAVTEDDEDLGDEVVKQMIKSPGVFSVVMLVQGIQDILCAPITLLAKTFFTFKNLSFKNFDDSKIVEEACQIAENALESGDKVSLQMALIALHKKSKRGKLSLDIEEECTLFKTIDTDVLERPLSYGGRGKDFDLETAKVLTNQYLSFFKRPTASSEITPSRVPPLV